VGNYNKNIRKVSLGLGFAVSWLGFHVGAARFKDFTFNKETNVTNRFYTNTFTFGAQIAKLGIDWSYIKSYSLIESRVRVLSASLFLKKFMFTYGLRSEESFFPKYRYDSDTFDLSETRKEETFLGAQWLPKDWLILGLYSNYYLNRRMSLGVTIFFK
jgi:hypothetical protein